MSIRDIVVLAVILLSLPVCFLRPYFGILVWTVMSFVNPQSFAWGLAQQSSPAFAVAVATLIGFCIFSPRLSFVNSREVILLIILWGWFTLTTVNSVQSPLFIENAESTWYHWQLVSKILLMTVITVAVVNSSTRLRWIALAVAGSFGLLIIKNLPFMIITGGGDRVYGPPNSMIADNNDFGLALDMALPFFFFLARNETNPKLKWTLGFLFLATIPAIFFTYSRGALLGLIAVIGCMLLQSQRKILLVPFVLFVVVFALLFTNSTWKARMSQTAEGNLDASAMNRINAWEYSWNLARDYPVMGGGFDAFTPALFQRYAPNPEDVHGPHSVYFGVLAEHGFTGLFLYLLLVASSFFSLRRIKKLARRFGDLRTADYADMLRFSLVGFLTAGAFLGRAYFDFYFLIIACVASLKAVSYSEWAHAAVSEREPSPEHGDLVDASRQVTA